MKNYILLFILSVAITSFSCNNPNQNRNKNEDSVSAGNTDSSGSQPVQASPGAANGGNATDTIARQNETAPRIDSVVRH